MNETIAVISNVTNGLFLFRGELLEKLVQKYRVVIIAGDTGGVDKLRSIGCEVIITSIDRKGTSILNDFILFSTYFTLIKRLKPIVVLTYTIKPNVYGGIVCSVLNIPYIANITGLGDAIENGGILSKISLKLYRIGLKKAQIVFFQNRVNAEFFLRKHIYRGKWDLLPGSGVNLERHRYEPYPIEDIEKPIIISVIGRISKDKGIDEVLNAAEFFQSNRVKIRLIGECTEPYTEIIGSAKKRGIIEYVKKQQNIHEWYKTSHAVLNASYHEGMSNVLLEACATGRPVLASRIPGCIEAFEDGVSGFAFEPKSVDSIVEALNRFIELPYYQKEQMGVVGRQRMEELFDRNIVINKYINEIALICNGSDYANIQ